MNHIVFVYPPATPISSVDERKYFNLCLGSAYCIAYLLQNGWQAQPFITHEPINVHQCVKQILAKKPKVVGFTVYNSNYCSCQLIASRLKETAPDTIIVFGGPTPSVQAKPVLETNRFVDICVRHEGEETCLELLTLLDNTNFNLEKASASLGNIRGISYRTDNQTIRENQGRDILLTNRKVRHFLDKYPSPYLSGLLDSPGLGIITSRGCSRHCTYCNCAVLSKRYIATHSPDRVVEELDYISKQTVNPDGAYVEIFDDAFTFLPSRALDICNRLIENRIKLPLSCATRCDRVDEELLDKMKEAGFNSISFSLESAVPRLLRVIGKVRPPTTKSDPDFEKETEFIEKLRKYTIYAKKIGFRLISISIMIGLPTETPQEGRQTVDMVRALGRSVDSYAHNILQVLPEAPIFFNYEKLGMKLVKLDNQVFYRTVHPYDPDIIKPAPRSHVEDAAVKEGGWSLKSMAFSPLTASNKEPGGFFTKLILWADTVPKELVVWLQDNLAVNGSFIQVYSNLDSALRHHRDNWENLVNYISPTLIRNCFYESPGTGDTLKLIPYQTHFHREQLGIAINLVNTKTALLTPAPGIDPVHTIAMDREKEDVLQCHGFLDRLAQNDNRVEDLFNAPLIPYISSLCRWEGKTPNCNTLETVIVDADQNVLTCWNGSPIGKVGMPFGQLMENLRAIHREAQIKRGCPNCKKQSECAGCIFPAPLTDGEYCELKTNRNTGEAAELLRTFDAFKELQ
ncbi:MAG: radical SAM protein [bacterium]|nr:radical SAM protein [bacterium]